MIRNVKALTVSAYLSMLFLGIASALVGAAARNIGLSAYQIGLMVAVQNIGFAISVSVAGALSDTYPKPRILLVGSLVLSVAFLTFYLSGLFWLNLVIMFFIGIGIGTYEGISDVMLLDLHPDAASLHISINHSFVTIGTLAITVYLLFLQMNWRVSVVQSGVIILALAVFYGLVRLPEQKRESVGIKDRLRILARERMVAVLFSGTVLAVGAELGSIGILTTFLSELRGFSQVTSKIGLITFGVGMATGRLLIGYLTRKGNIPRFIVALFGLSAVLFSVLYLIDLGALNWVILYLAGVSLSALLPLMLALGGLTYREMSGTVVGTIKLAIPVGGFLVPFLMSIIANGTSLQVSLFIFPVSFAVGLLLFLAETRPGKAWAATEPGAAVR